MFGLLDQTNGYNISMEMISSKESIETKQNLRIQKLAIQHTKNKFLNT